MSEAPRRKRKIGDEEVNPPVDTSVGTPIDIAVTAKEKPKPNPLQSVINEFPTVPDFTDITLPALQYFESKGIQTPQVWANQIRATVEKLKKLV